MEGRDQSRRLPDVQGTNCPTSEGQEEEGLNVLLAILVFCSAACIDFFNTRYIMAVQRRDAVRAGLWSVSQYGASLVGFLVVFKITLWMLPVEALGLFTGCVWSMRAKV